MNTFDILRAISNDTPYAYAAIQGTTVAGSLVVYGYNNGSILIVEASGLPTTGCNQGYHAVNIHEGSSCEGSEEYPFAEAGPVLELDSCPRPYRSGDIPPLLSMADGTAWYALYTGKFTPDQIVGRTITIHYGPNSYLGDVPEEIGPRIACGRIIELYRAQFSNI